MWMSLNGQGMVMMFHLSWAIQRKDRQDRRDAKIGSTRAAKHGRLASDAARSASYVFRLRTTTT
jgi:hypothetical protein